MRIGRRHGDGQVESVGNVGVAHPVVRLTHRIEGHRQRSIGRGEDVPKEILGVRPVEDDLGADGLLVQEVGVGEEPEVDREGVEGHHRIVQFEGALHGGTNCSRTGYGLVLDGCSGVHDCVGDLDVGL